MTKRTCGDDVDVLAAKAAKQNLTVQQFVLVCELADDLTGHSEGTIQPLILRRIESGCELGLFSGNACYRVQLIQRGKRCRLKCIREAYGRRATVIHESSDQVRGWEILRMKVLLMEGYECEAQRQFDTQKQNVEVNA
jgi:hypothetical protein